MRGKLYNTSSGALFCGITPAGAGKTVEFRCVKDEIEDHPRRCGENKFGKHIQVGATGSPPQVRGKRFVACLNSCIVGITPAGAGKTPSPGAET